MALQQFNIYPGLSPVRVVATANQTGTYINGPVDNGVKATFTYATGALVIDGVTVEVGDSVLLVGQTAANQNGIYICTVQGQTGVAAVLTRRDDFQNIEQIRTGQYVSVSAGTAAAGSLYIVVEPLPARFGIDDLQFNAAITSGLGTAAAKAASDDAQPTVASVDGATTANAVAVFSDAAGTVKDADAPVSLSQPIEVAGAITSTIGNITSGSSGDAGTFIAFPPAAANGTLILAAGNAGGAFNTTVTSGTMGQSTVYTIPDILAATGNIMVSTSALRVKSVPAAAAAGGAAAQSFTDAFCTAASNVVGNWVTQANAASVLTIVPGDGSFVVTSTADAGVGTFNYIITK